MFFSGAEELCSVRVEKGNVLVSSILEGTERTLVLISP